MKSIVKISKVSMLTAMAAVVMVMLPSYADCPPVDPLDHTVLLPVPGDCSSFYWCSNGVPILMHCPDGLYFNAEWDVCDWPQNVRCIDNKEEDDDCKKCGIEVVIDECKWKTRKVIVDSQGYQLRVEYEDHQCEKCAYWCDSSREGNCKESKLCPTGDK